jgi:molybdopterin-guanine dinucleotide biosynthesis protein A
VKEVGREALMRHDPDLLSFRNLNTPEELEKARILGEGRRSSS